MSAAGGHDRMLHENDGGSGGAGDAPRRANAPIRSLRRPRWEIGGHSDGTAASSSSTSASVASFVGLYRRRMMLGEGSDSEGAEALGRDGPSGDMDARIEETDDRDGNGDGSGQNSAKGSEPTMAQCVSMLEPHMAAFRERCESSRGAGGKFGEAVAADEVPPQILRVARFFRYRWAPMKRALLRPPPPPPDDGVEAAAAIEVGSAYRLRLARALHARGLLTAAEVDGLAAANERAAAERRRRAEGGDDGPNLGQQDEDGTPTNGAGGSRKRRRTGDDDLAERVRLALSGLPADAGGSRAAGRAVRHARSVLCQFCARWRELHQPGSGGEEEAAGVGDDREGGEGLPTPDRVADWALAAFAGLVLANGVDGLGSDEGGIEAAVATLVTDGAPSSPSDSRAGHSGEVGRAVRTRMEELLAPPLLDQLDGRQILVLSRLLSHLPPEAAEGYLVHSAARCMQEGGGAGLASLPKLVATYLSILRSRFHQMGRSPCKSPNSREIGISSFETRIRQKFEEGNVFLDAGINGLRGDGGKNCEPPVGVGTEFLDAIFGSVKYLLSSR